MKNKRTVGIVTIILGALVILIPKVIFPVCSGMIELINGKSLYMKCHWSAMAELLAGGLMVFDGILLFVFKKYETRLALSIMLFLFGSTVLLIPTLVIGMCEAATMKCRVGTEPALIVSGILTMLVAVVNILSQISLIKLERLHKERSVAKQ